MENAADALKMAAAILIFILAIASSFSLFGTAKQTADSIIGMRDKQAYLEAAELDNGILYTSSSAILGDTSGMTEEEIEEIKKQKSDIGGLTKNGDRLVNVDDVISTIYRYTKEKYGVTIVEKNTGKVIARYDTGTENLMRQYNNIVEGLDEYKKTLEKNTTTIYVTPDFTTGTKLEELYKIKVIGNNTGNIKYGAPWANDDEILKRINVDLVGEEHTYDKTIKYQGKNLLNDLNGKTIIEVTNEIDKSTYLEDGDNTTNLLQQYEMPTVEIVYIIY